MIREFDYNSITLQNIADNEHLEFVCDGDKQKVVVNSTNEKESEENECTN